MQDNTIDVIIGPERNPRQGFGAADILAWLAHRRQRSRGAEASRSGGRDERPAPVRPVVTGMDEFFAPVARSGDTA